MSRLLAGAAHFTSFRSGPGSTPHLHLHLPPALTCSIPHLCLIGTDGHSESRGARATATMGIKQLFSIIKEEAPDAIKEGEIKNQFGRKVAIVRSTLCTVACS